MLGIRLRFHGPKTASASTFGVAADPVFRRALAEAVAFLLSGTAIPPCRSFDPKIAVSCSTPASK
ncbi:MAG: hypothetical protein V4659_04950, partial [Pseudomonadota bacterium]